MSNPLQMKTINELLGEHFYVPSYQRGYRWTEQQVLALLNDIWLFARKPNHEIRHGEFYCLQPVVVKEKTWEDNGNLVSGYEVIDGQQRLTTIYIILSYLSKEFLKVDSLIDDYENELFTIFYQTRPGSGDFLKNIKKDKSYIDYYHMFLAYETIDKWFSGSENTKNRTDKNKFLDTLLGKKEHERSVQVIWYKIEQNQATPDDEIKHSINMFNRLNMGKIPLTNAELIKALFLSSSSFSNESPEDANRRKYEISYTWDTVEQELGNQDFWAFITNEKSEAYATKVELIFNLIAGKKKTEIDPLFTFLYFLEKSKDQTQLWQLWMDIQQYYYTLKQWYTDKQYYHKIGYLIAVGTSLRKLIDWAMQYKKTDFDKKIDNQIRASIREDYRLLSYEKDSERKELEKVLLLFNVEKIRTNENITEFYPFRIHKKKRWSLEHIHAQNSKFIDRTKKDQWVTWLNYHKKLIDELVSSSNGFTETQKLIDIQTEIANVSQEKLTWEYFDSIADKVFEAFSENRDDSTHSLHGIANLALLSVGDNAALSNSVFEVKRREIIRLDKQGSYIPISTRHAFLKYHDDKPSSLHYYFWSESDREKYADEIEVCLKKYLVSETKKNN